MKVRNFSAFNVDNMSTLSPSSKYATAANSICKSLDVLNKHTVYLEDISSFFNVAQSMASVTALT
jgi:hypothetical protein